MPFLPARPISCLGVPVPVLLLALAVSPGLLAAADDEADAWGLRLSAEAAVGYDTDPTLGSHQATRQIHTGPDGFGEGIAGVRLAVPVVPLVLSGRIEDREYLHQEAVDHVLIHSAAELPVEIRQSTLSPRFFVDNDWYGDAYYSTTTHGALRWTQEWTPAWSSDLIPFLEHTSYRPPFRGQDGTETGVTVSATWSLAAPSTLRALSLDVGGSRYEARVYPNSYSEGRLAVEQSYDLPGKVAWDLDLSWTPTRYHAPVASQRESRRDHVFEAHAEVKRPIGAGFSAKVACLLTNDQSNRPAQQYHETEVSAGLAWEFR